MTTYLSINLTTSLLSQLILGVKHKVWKQLFIIKKNINQLKVKKMTHIRKLKEKACQRSPFGAKMWNSHILCKLEQNLV